MTEHLKAKSLTNQIFVVNLVVMFSIQGQILYGFAAMCFDLTHVCVSGVL